MKLKDNIEFCHLDPRPHDNKTSGVFIGSDGNEVWWKKQMMTVAEFKELYPVQYEQQLKARHENHG